MNEPIYEVTWPLGRSTVKEIKAKAAHLGLVQGPLLAICRTTAFAISI